MQFSGAFRAPSSLLAVLRVKPVPSWKYLDPVVRTIAGIALVLLWTWFGFLLHLNLAAIGFLQLLVVLGVALKAGFWQATVVSLVANFCLNYFFIPPVFTFYIADSRNWVALIVFEISALVVSRLSTQARAQAARATNREQEMERLYEFSRKLLLLNRQDSPGPEILSLIQTIFGIGAAALFDASKARTEAIGSDTAALETETRNAFLQDRDWRSADEMTSIRVLRLGVRPIGALGMRGPSLNAVTAGALASLSAIALERAHSFERETHAEAERQSEQLRTTVLDALAHEYKTPLTVVRTAASGLIELGGLTATQSELIALVDSEVKRLSELTTRLLQMSRLDKADIRIRPVRINVEELIQDLLADTKSLLSRHCIRTQGLESAACIRADRELMNIALTQFLDNAAKYSAPASTITVAVNVLPAAVRFCIHSQSPPIPYEDRERIFERFYRSAGSNHKVAGTGIGLSISKKVAEAHRGRVWVTSSEEDGNTFCMELPLSKTEAR